MKEQIFDFKTAAEEAVRQDVKDVLTEQLTQNARVNSNNALDTISRAEAIDAICNSACGSKFCGLPCDDVAALKALPSAQPEVIRCIDCKHSEHWYRDKRRCFLWSEDGISVFNDGFCNYAERESDG